MNSAYLIFVILLLFKTSAFSQDTLPVQSEDVKGFGYYGPTRILIKLDPISRIPLGDIPFDRNFILRIYYISKDLPKKFLIVDKKGLAIQVGFYIIKNMAEYDAEDKTKVTLYAVDLVMPPLDPNNFYHIVEIRDQTRYFTRYTSIFKLIFANKLKDARDSVKFFRGASRNESIPTYRELKDYYLAKNLKAEFESYTKNSKIPEVEITQFLKENPNYTEKNGDITFLFQDINNTGILNTRQYKIETSAAFSLVADAGVIFTGFQKGFNTATPYVGVNFSFRPMDDDIPFSYLINSKRIHFWQRLTLNLGLTVNSVSKANYRDNIFGSNNIMAGVGFKFSHVVAITIGGLIYNNLDPNPLLNSKTMGIAPYCGLSFNLKIKEILKDISQIFTYAK